MTSSLETGRANTDATGSFPSVAPDPESDPGEGAPAPEPGTLKRFGAFSGVYTPSILTILGVIMYLRFGWVVGNAGLLGALLIVVVAHMITVATGMAVSSIATNRMVGAGGAYNIISRSLGAPVGAAVGIPLFLGQALSVTFYIVGFTEAVGHLVPGLPQKAVSSAVLLLLTLVALRSAAAAIKSQYIVMALIAASLVSFFVGGFGEAAALFGESPTREVVLWNPDGAGFSVVFAVFFPAVTGIMAGVGMSGDLRNPSRDLPLGTMAAIGTGFVVYLLIPLWFALTTPTEVLTSDNRVFWTVSRWPLLIYLGVWGATISSAVGSILTAPRTLQALGADGLMPSVVARGWGPANEPVVGLLVTWALAQAGILMGNLDVIAPVLTMFFLVTYGVVNLACGLERWARSPSFRPAFDPPSWVTLLGAVGCFYVMSIINTPAMLIALLCCALIFVVTERRDLEGRFGDARHGIWAALVRTALLQLRRREASSANWRPNVIIFGGPPDRRPHLLRLGSALAESRGLATYFHLLVGSVAEHAPEREVLKHRFEERVAPEHPNIFCRVDVVPDIYHGAVQVAQSYGVGTFAANTVVMGWTARPERWREYAGLLRDLHCLDHTLLLYRRSPRADSRPPRRLRVWWGGLHANGAMMLVVAYLLVEARPRDERPEVVVTTVVESPGEVAAAEERIRHLLRRARLAGEPRVLVRGGRDIARIMGEESEQTDLAMLGFAPPDPEDAGPFFARMNTMLDALPSTILICAEQGIETVGVLFGEEDAKTDS